MCDSEQMCCPAIRADCKHKIRDLLGTSIIIVPIEQYNNTYITAMLKGFNTIRLWFIVNNQKIEGML